jgi:hypothetical protein
LGRFTGGAPGIIVYGTGTADNWAAGSAGFEVHYLSTDANGVESYDMISANSRTTWFPPTTVGNADGLYQGDTTDYDALLTSEGIVHSTEPPSAAMAHRWDSGRVPIALAALEQESLNLH